MEKFDSKSETDISQLIEKLSVEISSQLHSSYDQHTITNTERVLNSKTKQLIVLCVAITAQQNEHIAFQINNALKSGASTKEIMETIELAIYSWA